MWCAEYSIHTIDNGDTLAMPRLVSIVNHFLWLYETKVFWIQLATPRMSFHYFLMHLSMQYPTTTGTG